MSEFLDGVLSGAEIEILESHVSSCAGCLEVRKSMAAVLEWGRQFPDFVPPEWLATRILANTPKSELEPKWNTGVRARRWPLGTRTATAVFTALVMLAWMADAVDVSLEPAQLRNPRAIYYRVDGLVGDAYDRVVRLYYQAPLIVEIQSRIEQLRNSS